MRGAVVGSGTVRNTSRLFKIPRPRDVRQTFFSFGRDDRGPFPRRDRPGTRLRRRITADLKAAAAWRRDPGAAVCVSVSGSRRHGMTDREALLRAIAANPDDDTPRLIYADCVEETGRPEDVARARFIRLQLDTYRGPGDTGGPDAFNRKLAQARALATPFVQAWLGELPDWAAKFLRQHERITVDDFRRGFLA